MGAAGTNVTENLICIPPTICDSGRGSIWIMFAGENASLQRNLFFFSQKSFSESFDLRFDAARIRHFLMPITCASEQQLMCTQRQQREL
jgi:hypothetical protein